MCKYPSLCQSVTAEGKSCSLVRSTALQSKLCRRSFHVGCDAHFFVCPRTFTVQDSNLELSGLRMLLHDVHSMTNLSGLLIVVMLCPCSI